MSHSLQDRATFAIALAKRAGELGLAYFRSIETLTIESKGHQDLVSNGDREVELLIRAAIAEAYPDDGIVGEEHGPVVGTSGFVWVIDPIDGTANYVRGIPTWAVVIACMQDQACVVGVVHEPAVGETFHAFRGGGAFMNDRPIRVSTSRSLADGSVGVGVNSRTDPAHLVPLIDALLAEGGIFFRNASGAIMLAYVAAGRLIGYTEEHMNAWDCVAAMLIIEEAGGVVEPYNRGDVLANGTIAIAATPSVFDKVRALSLAAYGSI